MAFLTIRVTDGVFGDWLGWERCS